jgi:hypothetical protein
MKSLFLALTTLLLATGALFAQGFGGGMPGGNSGNPLMVSTPKGLFALRGGVLAKFNPTTLKSEQIFELFGPMPERPANATDRDAMQKYFTELQRRNAPPVMLVKDNSLLIVIGDGFARLEQDTLKVEATGDLRAPGAAAPAGGRGRAEGAPGYLLVNNTLFLMRGTELLSVSVTDGKVLARSPLPKELQPQAMTLPNMGGRDAGRGGRAGGNQ